MAFILKKGNMRFRRLTSEELSHLEKEFIEFLVANTVTADDWIKLKDEKPENAEELIEMFSDVVLLKVYSKIVLLEKRAKNDLLLFKFDGDMIQMLGVSSQDESIDFTDFGKKSFDLKGIKLEGFKTTKVLAKESKPDEVFQLLESGCYIGNVELYKTLDAIIE